jgi:4'-phosphopantetheinyl transferase EntD
MIARPGAVPPAFAARSPLDLLVPKGVAVAVARAEVEVPLFPEEETALRRAVEGRRREFRTGRACAREALARLGLELQAIPAGADGSPRWPPGVVGSITHCRGCRAAAVGRATDFDAIGMDAEPHQRLPGGVLRAVALPVELERVGWLLRKAPGPPWDRLLFVVKEATYKAWFPLTGTKLGFEDAEVAFDPAGSTFSVGLRVPCPERGEERPVLRGRWGTGGGIVAAAIALPRAPNSSLPETAATLDGWSSQSRNPPGT